MIKLAVFVVVIVVAACQAPVAEPQPPKYCCTPDKWQGIQAGIGGTVVKGEGQAMTTMSFIAFDRTIKRIFAYTNTTTAQGNFSTMVIQDYKDRTQWTIDVKAKTCKKSELTTPFNNGCVPDDARYIGKFYFGAGKEMLNGKSYSSRVQQEGTLLDVTLSVTENGCIPLSEAYVGSANGVPVVITLGFVNIIPEITDPSLFNPPSFCQQNATIAHPPFHVEPKYRIFHI